MIYVTTTGAMTQSTLNRYVTAVETAGRARNVEQSKPNVPTMIAVIMKTSEPSKTWDGATPPKKKTRLKSGMDAAIKRNAFTSPATSLPETKEKAESFEQRSKSNVCRSFSPFTDVAVKAGVIKRMRKSCTTESK